MNDSTNIAYPIYKKTAVGYLKPTTFSREVTGCIYSGYVRTDLSGYKILRYYI